MAVDIFLKIERHQGRVAGLQAQGRNRRPVLVLGHAPVRHRALGRRRRRRQGDVQDLNFTHYIDKASSDAVAGMLPTASTSTEGQADRPQGRRKDPLEYLKIKMEDILVSRVSDRRLARRGPADRERHAQLPQVQDDYSRRPKRAARDGESESPGTSPANSRVGELLDTAHGRRTAIMRAGRLADRRCDAAESDRGYRRRAVRSNREWMTVMAVVPKKDRLSPPLMTRSAAPTRRATPRRSSICATRRASG